ncbi:hypothetical protein [Limnospira platensis]|uniref:hypothetical protein n=1 Tax=Limnospira platensis TaxID=118562 RepID=UPI0002E6FB33|nr:hypothetical protein [Arthrospira platensis NCB002]
MANFYAPKIGQGNLRRAIALPPPTVNFRRVALTINLYPDSDSGLLLNPITMPSYSNITHNLVLAQENNSVNG